MKSASWTLAAGAATAPLTVAAARPAPAASWTGTWSASPQSGGEDFHDRTVRQIVRTSLSGPAARIHLPSAFGSRPLTVRDALDQAGVRWVIVSDDPVNDLTSKEPGADQLIDGPRQLVSRARARGVKILCSTLTPFEGFSAWNCGPEAKRAAVNAFGRGADGGRDAVVDQDGATHDPDHPTRFRADLDGGDHLHPDEAGLAAIATAVDPDRLN